MESWTDMQPTIAPAKPPLSVFTRLYGTSWTAGKLCIPQPKNPTH